MTNYLIRHITDSTGHTFTEVIKPRENERYEIVSAESKEDILSWYKKHEETTDWNNINKKTKRVASRPKGLLSVVPSSFNNGPISRALSQGNK